MMKTTAIFGLILFSIISQVLSHVALTYPPARKYDLDFLDNSRTKGPCGMPKGSTSTSFLSGTTFNVTWHLAYPHRGGFRLHLLDELDRPVLDLTPSVNGSEFVRTDSTAQSFETKIPNDFICHNCTLRLLRQADEWSSGYRFWSCADVDIKDRKEFRETCSGNGKYFPSRCKCSKNYYGNRCQYRDECTTNQDCGIQGQCIDLEGTSLPRKQCYCNFGWFGANCNKKSPFVSTDIDFSIYSRKQLSPDYQVYWRILKDSDEVEIVMVVNGTSWVGLGWRPSGYTASCKNFPRIYDPKIEQNSNIEPTAEPESNPSPKNKRVAKSESTTTSGGITISTSVSYKVSAVTGRNRRAVKTSPEPSSEAIPEPISEAIPEPSSEAIPEPSSEAIPEPTSEAIPEPSSEAIPEPSSEAIPEPTSEAIPEPISEAIPEPSSETIPEPSSEAIPEPSSEAIPEPSSEPVQTKANQPKNLNPYTPKHDFNPMDCTDIIIGSARGKASRVGDYYTRDRSTPRLDEFYGGKGDLTAATGFEENGVTTILFRRKLNTSDSTDHPFTNELMHLIWARGQEPNNYIHFPLSGLEKEHASVKQFYRPDELKYHGHKMQRGSTYLNFFEIDSPIISTTSETANNLANDCFGNWRYPQGCSYEEHKCEYFTKWATVGRGDEMHWYIETSNTQQWTGIGFSNDEKMSQTDTVIGWVDRNGRPFLMDTWIVGYQSPKLDDRQDIYNMSGRIENGVTILEFVRKRSSNDDQDLSFTDDECLYLLFPIAGGTFNAVNKKIKKHEKLPIVSPKKICIKSCKKELELIANAITTPAPDRLAYSIGVRLMNLAESFTVPERGSVEFNNLAKTISDSLNGVLNTIPGYYKTDVQNFEKDESGIIAKMNLLFDKDTFEKGNINQNVNNNNNNNDQNISDNNADAKIVKQALLDSVATGKVGSLNVDPSFLDFEALEYSMADTNNGSMESFFQLSEVRLYIVLGCIAALVFIALIQAGCTIYKTSKKSKNQKDQLIPNSAWKDYSSNTNYAFDSFGETEEKNGKGQSRSRSTSSQQTLQMSHSPNGKQNYHDSRSSRYELNGDSHHYNHRYQNGEHAIIPRSSYADRAYSLPRTIVQHHQSPAQQGYYTQDRRNKTSRHHQGGSSADLNRRSTSGGNDTPDFYFMPSQRKYSGEVVRVYVDYNKDPKN